MGKVVADFTMSLDGFIAGPDDEVGALFGWYFSGDTEVAVQGGKMVFKLSPTASAYSTTWGRSPVRWRSCA